MRQTNNEQYYHPRMKDLCYKILSKVEHMGWISNPDVPNCLEHHLENRDAFIRIDMTAFTIIDRKGRILAMFEDPYLPELTYSLAVAWRNRELEKAYKSIFACLESLT